jgi:uncharacterized membrane protein YozB (DUF420 family)
MVRRASRCGTASVSVSIIASLNTCTHILTSGVVLSGVLFIRSRTMLD